MLGSCAGVHWATAHALGQRGASSPAVVVSYVDAALEGAVVASLGWCSHGRYWTVAIAELGLDFMSITPLEFLAYGIEVILAGGDAGDGARVAIYTDSLSSVDVLCGEAPHRPRCSCASSTPRSPGCPSSSR